MSATAPYGAIQINPEVVRQAGITPWRIALWAKAEARPERRRNLLRAVVAMLQNEADRAVERGTR